MGVWKFWKQKVDDDRAERTSTRDADEITNQVEGNLTVESLTVRRRVLQNITIVEENDNLMFGNTGRFDEDDGGRKKPGDDEDENVEEEERRRRKKKQKKQTPQCS